MNRCPQCQHICEQEDRFCGNCGILLMEEINLSGSTQEAIKLSEIHLSLGIVYYKKRKYAEAVEKFKQVLQKDPDNALANKLLAQAEKGMKETAGTL